MRTYSSHMNLLICVHSFVVISVFSLPLLSPPPFFRPSLPSSVPFSFSVSYFLSLALSLSI